VGLNIAEVTGLADAKKKRVRRLPGLFLVIAEVLTAVLCIVLPLVVYGAASFSHGCNLDAPLTDCPNGELILPANRSSLAFIFIITTAYVTPPPPSPLSLPTFRTLWVFIAIVRKLIVLQQGLAWNFGHHGLHSVDEEQEEEQLGSSQLIGNSTDIAKAFSLSLTTYLT